MHNDPSAPMRSPRLPRWALPVIAILVIGGAFFGGLIFGQRGADRRDPTAALAPQVASEAEDHANDGTGLPFPEIARIDVAETQARIVAGTVLLVDARSAEQYDAGHAEGALLLGSPELDVQLSSLAAGTLLVTYCT